MSDKLIMNIMGCEVYSLEKADEPKEEQLLEVRVREGKQPSFYF